MTTDYKKEQEERDIIQRETKKSRMFALYMLISIPFLAIAAYFIKIDLSVEKNLRENLYWVLIFVIILILIVILSVRKTIYYSSKIIKEEFTLTEILKKWTTIDTVLILMAEIIPILGLIITWLGMPFERTWFIFLVSALLMIILMPIGLKVRSKLVVLKKYSANI